MYQRYSKVNISQDIKPCVSKLKWKTGFNASCSSCLSILPESPNFKRLHSRWSQKPSNFYCFLYVDKFKEYFRCSLLYNVNSIQLAKLRYYLGLKTKHIDAINTTATEISKFPSRTYLTGDNMCNNVTISELYISLRINTWIKIFVFLLFSSQPKTWIYNSKS